MKERKGIMSILIEQRILSMLDVVLREEGRGVSGEATTVSRVGIVMLIPHLRKILNQVPGNTSEE
jgi:hypothetical protein